MSATLVLNATYEPLCVVPLRRAVVLVLAEKATVIEEGAGLLRSERHAMPVPSVVRLSHHVRVPYRRSVPLTRRGVLQRDQHRCAYCRARAETVDHVVPRSRGGTNEASNLRLAHRRCNGRRGSHLPELDWPSRLGALDTVPLWQAIARLVRRPGRHEVVALLPTAELAEEAAAWVEERAEAFVPGGWDVAVAPVGDHADLHVLRLTRPAASGSASAGRPRVADTRRSKQGRRSRRR